MSISDFLTTEDQADILNKTETQALDPLRSVDMSELLDRMEALNEDARLNYFKTFIVPELKFIDLLERRRIEKKHQYY